MLPRSEPLPTTTTGHYTICCKNLSLALLKMGKVCPKHVELILEINKLLLLHLVSFLYYFTYCKADCTSLKTVKVNPCKSSFKLKAFNALRSVIKRNQRADSNSDIRAVKNVRQTVAVRKIITYNSLSFRRSYVTACQISTVKIAVCV